MIRMVVFACLMTGAAPAMAATAKQAKDCALQAQVVSAVQAARVARVAERKVADHIAQSAPEWPEKYNGVIPLVTPWVYSLKRGELRSSDLGAAWEEMCLAQ